MSPWIPFQFPPHGQDFLFGKDLDINWIFDKITLSCSVGLTTGLLARGHQGKSEMGTASEKGDWKIELKKIPRQL